MIVANALRQSANKVADIIVTTRPGADIPEGTLTGALRTHSV